MMLPKPKDRMLETDIIARVRQLLSQLETGDVIGARSSISMLNEVRENSLFKDLGKLTRELHETLKSINIGSGDQHMPSVQVRLQAVIKVTEDAANITMDGIEATIPISNALATEARILHEKWDRLGRHEMSPEEFRALYPSMLEFMKSVEKSAASIHDKLEQVLVAQNYQDLTGQAIKKVMDVVTDLEKRLVHLVALTAEAGSTVESADGKSIEVKAAASDDAVLSAEEQTKKEFVNHVVSGQDEVDDLLSSLGF